jgi:hypothetical protein
MRWFRVRGRLAAYVALFALLSQLVLSFGHVHLAHADSPGIAVAATGAGGHKSTPQQPGTDHDDDYCAVCAIIALLTGAQVAAAPAIPVPAVLAVADNPIAAAATHIGSQRGAFRSRAPPSA